MTDINDLDDMGEQHQTTIHNILDEHCPKKRRKVRVDNSFFMSPLIEKIKTASDRAHKNHKKSSEWIYLGKLMKRATEYAHSLFIKICSLILSFLLPQSKYKDEPPSVFQLFHDALYS